jgi:hypothetical protein
MRASLLHPRTPSTHTAAGEDAGAEEALRFFRGVTLALVVSIVAWGVLAALGFGVYALVTSG